MFKFKSGFARFGVGHRLRRALSKSEGGKSISHYGKDMVDWITPELLEQHKTFPYTLAPFGHRSYVMNLRPKDVNFWSMGKEVQRLDGVNIPFECIAEVQAGYWEFLRREVLLTSPK